MCTTREIMMNYDGMYTSHNENNKAHPNSVSSLLYTLAQSCDL